MNSFLKFIDNFSLNENINIQKKIVKILKDFENGSIKIEEAAEKIDKEYMKGIK